MVGGSQSAQVKLSDGSVKTVTTAGHLSKPGMTTLRMTGGVITAASSTPSSVSSVAAGNQQQVSFLNRFLSSTCISKQQARTVKVQKYKSDMLEFEKRKKEKSNSLLEVQKLFKPGCGAST